MAKPKAKTLLESGRIIFLPVDELRPNPAQPRRIFDETALQELVQRQPDQELVYRMAGESGPDHNKTFLAEVLLNGAVVGAGEGHSKKEAEQSAARAALEKLQA